MTMSANAVTHASVEHIADALEKFGPQLLCAYPSALETLCALPARQRPPLVDTGRGHFVGSVPAGGLGAGASRSWAAGMADYYGQAERIAFAYANAPRRVPVPAWLLVRRVHSVRRSARAGATASTGCTRSSARRSGTACCPSCVIAPAISCVCRRAGANANSRSCRWVCARSPACSAVSRNCWCARRRAHHRHRMHAATTSSNVLRFQVVQEDLDEARILVLPDERFSRERRGAAARQCARANSAAVDVDRRDRAAARAHAARQDAAHRSPAAGSRCASPPWRRAARSRGDRMQQPGWYLQRLE